MKRKQIVYIAGPVTGMPGNNYAAFNTATEVLKRNGYIAINPTAQEQIDPHHLGYEHYMALDVVHVTESDLVVVLPGWDNSVGAQHEIIEALILKKPIHFYDADLGVGIQIYPRRVARATLEPESPSETAYRIVRGERRESYGHPLEDYTRTAKLWSAVLGFDVTPEQALLCMILVKVSRETHTHNKDNLIDICGYAECLQMAIDKKQNV